MPSQFFIQRSGKVVGPLTKKVLKTKIRSGKIRASDEIGSTSVGPWKEIGDVPTLSKLLVPQSADNPLDDLSEAAVKMKLAKKTVRQLIKLRCWKCKTVSVVREQCKYCGGKQFHRSGNGWYCNNCEWGFKKEVCPNCQTTNAATEFFETEEEEHPVTFSLGERMFWGGVMGPISLLGIYYVWNWDITKWIWITLLVVLGLAALLFFAMGCFSDLSDPDED